MQMQKRKLRAIFGIILLLFFVPQKLVAKDEKYYMIQYKNFVSLGYFKGLPHLPAGDNPLVITKESADAALYKFSNFLLDRAKTDHKAREIVFGLERYFIQIVRIRDHEQSLILLNAYREEDCPPGGPSKEWFSAEGGGTAFWGGTIYEKDGKIEFIVNDLY